MVGQTDESFGATHAVMRKYSIFVGRYCFHLVGARLYNIRVRVQNPPCADVPFHKSAIKLFLPPQETTDSRADHIALD